MNWNENKKLICFVIPSLHSGGMERVMSILISRLASDHKDLDLHLILYGKNRDVFYEIPSQVKIHRPSFQFDDRNRFINTIRTILFLRKQINNLKADSILSFGERWNNLVLLSGLGLRWPIYVSDRCQPDLGLGRMQDFLRKTLYPNALGVIAQTSQAKSIFQKMYSHPNIAVIGNPIKTGVNNINTDKKENIVLSIGRLIDSKHHEELIDLFVNLNLKAWKLVIVGGDALKQNNFERLSLKVKNLGVQDKVILTGTVKDVAYWYERSKIFAFPSSSEGFPNVIGEALAQGLPTVAFDCIAGPRDLISDGVNGFLVENLNFNEFSVKLKSLMDNETLRINMSDVAPKSVEQYNESSISRRFYNFITSHFEGTSN